MTVATCEDGGTRGMMNCTEPTKQSSTRLTDNIIARLGEGHTFEPTTSTPPPSGPVAPQQGDTVAPKDGGVVSNDKNPPLKNDPNIPAKDQGIKSGNK